MKKLILLFLIAYSNMVFADATLSGEITTNTTVDGVVKITSSITIDTAVTLTFTPGSHVEISDDVEIIVQGNIVAQGTSTDSIVFSRAKADESWGGIFFKNIPKVTDSTIFEYCRVSGVVKNENSYGFARGGAFYFNNLNKARISHSAIYNNTASTQANIDRDNTEGMGGAIYATNSDIIIDNNEFYKNGALYGAAVYSSFGKPKITNSIFNNNMINNSYGSGGGIRLDESDAFIENCLFMDNASYYATYTCSGNGIYIYNSNTTIKNCFLKNNNSKNDGGIYIGFFPKDSLAYKISLINSFSDRKITIKSSSIAKVNFNVVNSTITNKIGLYGDAEFDLNVTNAIITGGIEELPATAAKNVKKNIFNSNVKGISDSLKTANGNIDELPRFVNVREGNYKLHPTSPCIGSGTVDTSSLSLGSTDLAGNKRVVGERVDMGAFEYFADGTVWEVPIYSDTLYGEIGSDITISGSVFVSDTVKILDGATLTIAPGTKLNVSHKALFHVKGAINANGTVDKPITFKREETNSPWAGFYIQNVDSTNDSTIFNFCNISGAQSHYDYGAFYIDGIKKMRLSNSIIKENSIFFNDMVIGAEYGSAIRMHSSAITIVNCVFSKNIGTAIYSSYSELTLKQCTISDGDSAYNGGAIYTTGDKTTALFNCKISNNKAHFGGAIYSKGPADTYLNNCTVENNFAEKKYGAIYAKEGYVVFERGQIKNNSATSIGAISSKNSYMIGCEISGNTSIDSSYAFDIDNITIRSSLFYCESIKERINSQTTTIINCSIIHRDESESMVDFIQLSGTSPSTIINTIIYSVNDNGWISMNPKGTLINCDFVGGDDPKYSDLYNEVDCIYGAPGFVDVDSKNFRLNELSPCIDKGYSTQEDYTNKVDLDSNARLHNSIIDIGAYEYFKPTSVTTLHDDKSSIIELYPNPVVDKVHITSEKTGNFVILDKNENIVATVTNGFADVSKLQVGVYFAVLKDGNNIVAIESFYKN